MSDAENFTPRAAERTSTEALVAAVAPITKPRKRIVTTVTLVTPGQEHEPFQHSDSGRIISGKYHEIAWPPGNPVELDAAEADRILARHGGEVVGPDFEIAAGVGKPVETRRVE